MNHAGEGLIQAYVDGEVTGAAKAELDAHLAACLECGHELEELRSAAATFRGAMARLTDGPVLAGAGPNSSEQLRAARERILRAHKAETAQSAPAAIAAEAGPANGPATVTSIESRRRFSRLATGSLVRAAGLVLVLAGGVAAMMPGSPLRRWIGERIASVMAPRTATAPVVTAAPPVVRREMVPGAEMSIAAVDGKISVHVFAESGKGTLTVRIVDSERATVQTDSSAHAVSFRTAPGSIDLMNLGNADAAVQLPRSLRGAEIDVNGKHFLIKEGDSLHVTGPVVKRTETEIVFQTGS